MKKIVKVPLKNGKLADFVILSDNPVTVDAETLDQLQVLITIKEGQVIYKAKEGEQKIKLRQSPFMSDPGTAHLFLHAMYRGAGVKKPIIRCMLRDNECAQIFGVPVTQLK
ncbi:MAG: amidohydrolase family protein [Tateyamaria sp.]|nr:amidohydrolase family protein [Tateyamaria sp.]MDG1420758.1 amidohydrolase family protein [Tateyamaria sp.]MDG1678498.1 amidohydrolase family protein [Tateyamaria sp.]MDG2377688.1 amidohydrolase family protein [Tateyamaria sp.]